MKTLADYGIYKPDAPYRENYESEFSFVETPEQIVTEKFFYVEFKSEKIHSGYYKDDQNGYLETLAHQFMDNKYRNSQTPHMITDPDIKNVQKIIRYYAYVKMVYDQDPSKIGNYYVFPFGRKIYTIINDFVQKNSIINSMYESTFHLVIDRTIMGFPNFDNSHFTDRSCEHEKTPDNKITELIHHPIYKSPAILLRAKRREKLEKLFPDQ